MYTNIYKEKISLKTLKLKYKEITINVLIADANVRLHFQPSQLECTKKAHCGYEITFFLSYYVWFVCNKIVF